MAGAQPCPPGLTALREAGGSNVAGFCYTVPYAIGYVVITLWGPMSVAVIHFVHRQVERLRRWQVREKVSPERHSAHPERPEEWLEARKEAVVVNKWRLIWAVVAMGATLTVNAVAQSAKPGQASAKPVAPSTSTNREQNLKAYVELLRSDLRTQKVAVITEVMNFTDAEDQAFWPIYRQYETELARLNDERLQNIETYAKNYTNLSDAVANDLVTKALDLEARRAALKQKLFLQLKGAMSPKTAARAMQVESQILLLLDLQVAASLPIAE